MVLTGLVGCPAGADLQAWKRSISNPAARGRTIAQYVNKICSESRAPVAYRQGSSIDGLGKECVNSVVIRNLRVVDFSLAAVMGHDEPPDYGPTFKSGRGAIAATPRQGRPGRAIKARAEHFGKRLITDMNLTSSLNKGSDEWNQQSILGSLPCRTHTIPLSSKDVMLSWK